MMTDRPWETEPNSLNFEADGLPCAMRRNDFGAWCGYVSVGPEHPLFGLPYNHPLKLPAEWFKGRVGLEGAGPIDLFIHAMRGKKLTESCEISLAFQVHGGITYAYDNVRDREPDGRWWFGFDCSHAGDYTPKLMESMPAMRAILGVYRDQQYVVSECQSLAAQLIAVIAVIEGNGEYAEKS